MLNITAIAARALTNSAIEESILANLDEIEKLIIATCAETKDECAYKIQYPPCYMDNFGERYDYAAEIARRLSAAGFNAFVDIINEVLSIDWD